MTARESDPDEAQVRRAAVTMTRQITLATCLVVLVIVAAAVAAVMLQMRPSELAEPARPGETRIHVNATTVVIALVAIAAATVVYALVISWVISRRAVQPLAHALQVQRAFVADASHELRTPLTVLDARVQLLQRRLDRHPPDDRARQTAAELRQDTRQLIEIVNDLLATAGGDAEQAVPADAAAVVRAGVEDLRILAASRRIELRSAAPREVRVTMPQSSLRRCVTALVDNAMTHSPAGGVVETTLTVWHGRALLSVVDYGPGIRGITPERVFDRFAHADPPADGEGPAAHRGFGIGLALVRELAAGHGGSVRVVRTGPSGTTMELSLPLAPGAPATR